MNISNLLKKFWIPAFAGMTIVGVHIFIPAPVHSGNGVIKFATLAPEGSTWMKVLREWDKEVTQKSGGKLRFKIYSGGVSGDEKDVVRKIRLGQLHAGGFTGVGLGEIAPEARVLDSPFLFHNTDEIDYIYHKFDLEWRAAFENKGFVFLGWTEVGFIYFFTKQPIESISELKKIRMWMWEGDPIAEAAFKSLGVRPIPLSIADVMSSLQTGLIDGVYTSPLAAIVLQWFTRTKYMYNYSLANATGAVLISKKFFDELSPELRELLQSSAKNYLGRITTLSREENNKSIEVLKKNGMTILGPPSPKLIAEYQEAGKKARSSLVGRLYSADLLKKMEKALLEYRAKSKS